MTTRTFRIESTAPVIMVSCGIIGLASLFTYQYAIAIVCVALGMAAAFGQPALENAGDDPALRAGVLKRLGIGVLVLIIVLSASAIISSRMGHTIDEIAASERLDRDARFLYQADVLAHHEAIIPGSWASLTDDQRAVWQHRAEAVQASIPHPDGHGK